MGEMECSLVQECVGRVWFDNAGRGGRECVGVY